MTTLMYLSLFFMAIAILALLNALYRMHVMKQMLENWNDTEWWAKYWLKHK